MVFEEKTVSSEVVFKGKIIDVRVDMVSLPNGEIAQRDIVKHPGGVGIVAVTEDRKIIMVKQFRKPIEKAIYEIPAGKLDPNEEIEKCGKRELEEETGYRAKKFEYLGYMYPSPGFDDEVTHLYLATELEKGKSHPDEDEFLDVEYFSIDKVLEMIMENKINDGKTVIGFFKAMEKLKGGRVNE